MPKRLKLKPSMSRLQSSISNGKLLADLDHRGAWARRLRDLIGGMVSDLGGETNISTAERLLIRRGSMMALQLELLEQQFASKGGMASTKELDAYQRAANSLRRTLSTLGLQRRMKTVDFHDYVKRKAEANSAYTRDLDDMPVIEADALDTELAE